MFVASGPPWSESGFAADWARTRACGIVAFSDSIILDALPLDPSGIACD
jgi:hypothetical protein